MRLEGPFTRSEKRLIRSKGSLRCQWCHRWTEISPGYDWASLKILKKKGEKRRKPKPDLPIGDYRCWEEYVEANADRFLCQRETCVADRRQAM